MDFLASFAAFVGIEVPKTEAIDSRNSLSTLLGNNKIGSDYIIEEAGILAVRKGPWKLIEGRKSRQKKNTKLSLYNLDKDIMEQKNVADQYPEIVKSLHEIISKVKQGDGLKSLSPQ